MTEWCLAELGEIMTLNYGWSLPEKKRASGEVPVYGSNGIVGYHNEALVKSSGIIVGRKGSGGRIQISHVPFCPIDTTFFTTQSDTQLDLQFLYYLLLHVDLQKLVTGVGVPGLNRELAYHEKVNYPKSRNEQKCIASILSTVQTAIKQQERLIALTRELKSAMMYKLVTEGLHGDAQKQTEVGLIPESWSVVKLQEAVAYIDYGYSAPIPKTEPADGIKIVSTADINKAGELLYWKIRRTIAPERTIGRLLLKDGDVLFNWRNSAELIGKTTIYEEQPDPHIFASFILRIRCDENKTDNRYLKYLLNYYREREVFVKLSRRAVNQANYNRNEILELKIPYPPISEQLEIVSLIGKVDKKINLHEEKKNLLEELFRTLLNQLMTRQVPVNEFQMTF